MDARGNLWQTYAMFKHIYQKPPQSYTSSEHILRLLCKYRIKLV